MEQESRDQEETPYLIAHLVRGKPAFDIAIKMNEMVWIIPTSGHRAYPYWSLCLDQNRPENSVFEWGTIYQPIPSPPPNWPDHYAANNPSQKPLTKLAQRGMMDLKLEDLEL